MEVHPRLSLNCICSMQQSFDDDLALWADLGITHVGLVEPKVSHDWDGCAETVRQLGLQVSSFSCYPDGMAPSIEFSGQIATPTLYLPAGRAGGAPWEQAAESFCAAMAPWVARGKEVGVRLAVEPTNPLRSDVSFLHTVRDAADLARMADVDVVVDFYSAWYERDIARTIAENIDVVGLVQVCDYKLGTFNMPNRCAVGDGDIPVEKMLRALLDAGYEGPFDLEILGPQVEEEGYRAPIVRSLERLTEMLDRLGA